MTINQELSLLVREHLHDDVQQLALQRNRYPQLSDADFRFLLQQIDGFQRTKDKLPSIAKIENWWYPVRLSCEQCSSEATAQYKTKIINQLEISKLIDLTGGYGIDSFFISEHVTEADYVERNPELCAIAAHNFAMTRPQIRIHNTTAEVFLSEISSPTEKTLIYLDPARRSASGSKVFRMEDCEPNIIELLPTLRRLSNYQCFKLSPMIDITAATQALGKEWDVHVVAVQNEVKEVVFINGRGNIYAVNIQPNQTDIIDLQQKEEQEARCKYAEHIYTYLYEPNAAIIKAGAFKYIGERYGIHKLDVNTHLYTSEEFVRNFPGRVWQVIAPNIKDSKELHLIISSQTDKSTPKYSVMTRNYPLTPEQLRKKMKLQDGDDFYLIGARMKNQPIRIVGYRIK